MATIKIFSLVENYNNGQDITNRVFSTLAAATDYVENWAWDGGYEVDWYDDYNAHVYEMGTEFIITPTTIVGDLGVES